MRVVWTALCSNQNVRKALNSLIRRADSEGVIVRGIDWKDWGMKTLITEEGLTKLVQKYGEKSVPRANELFQKAVDLPDDITLDNCVTPDQYSHLVGKSRFWVVLRMRRGEIEPVLTFDTVADSNVRTRFQLLRKPNV